MPFFPAMFIPTLRPWDKAADEAAIVAQIFCMAKLLSYPFNTALFDTRIKRQPGKPIANAHWQRVLAAGRPRLTICYAGPPVERILQPDLVRMGMEKAGHKPDAVTRYLASSRYKLRCARTSDMLAVQAELASQRYRLVSSNKGHARTKVALEQGSIAVVRDSGGAPLLLVPHNGGRNQIQVYDPRSGTGIVTLDRLRRTGRVDLDKTGTLLLSIY